MILNGFYKNDHDLNEIKWFLVLLSLPQNSNVFHFKDIVRMKYWPKANRKLVNWKSICAEFYHFDPNCIIWKWIGAFAAVEKLETKISDDKTILSVD